MPTRPALVALAALVPLLAGAAAPRRPSPVLARIIEEDWQHELQDSPTFASVLGDRRWNGRWDDLSRDAVEARQRHDLETVRRLDGLLAGRLSDEDRLNAELLRKDHAWWAEAHELGWHLLPTNHMGGLPEGVRQPPGVQTAYQLADQLPFESAQDYRDWISRLRGFGAYVDQVIGLMREGVARRLVHPRIVLSRIPAQLDHQLAASPDRSEWYAPFTRFPASLREADREGLAAAGAAAVRDQVLPALGRFRAFLVEVYIPAAPEAVGAWQWPRGDEIYAYWARRSTTTDLTPDALHALGLQEVARIREEMERVKERAGFAGPLAEFFTFLRSDPRFYHSTPEALLLHYRDLAKRIDPTLVKLFRTLPRMPYGVEPTPAGMAPDVTTGFY
jgi:uncharacterized protein (DUF885 family)